MTSRSKQKTTDQRLHEIRRAATVSSPLPGQSHHAQIHGYDSYYGLPALKPPVWTWEVPLYFFIGGIAGVSSCIAFLAHLFGADPALIRLSLWFAFVGA